MTASEHPGRETLWEFGLGRLDRRAMVAVEGHLRQCPQCGRIGLGAPDDRLVTLLRAASSDRVSGFDSARRASRNLKTIVLLLCLAGVAGSPIAGCSGGQAGATFSPAVQAKAKESFKKKFAGDDRNQSARKASR